MPISGSIHPLTHEICHRPSLLPDFPRTSRTQPRNTSDWNRTRGTRSTVRRIRRPPAKTAANVDAIDNAIDDVKHGIVGPGLILWRSMHDNRGIAAHRNVARAIDGTDADMRGLNSASIHPHVTATTTAAVLAAVAVDPLSHADGGNHRG